MCLVSFPDRERWYESSHDRGGRFWSMTTLLLKSDYPKHVDRVVSLLSSLFVVPDTLVELLATCLHEQSFSNLEREGPLWGYLLS